MPDSFDDTEDFINSSSRRIEIYNDLRAKVSETLQDLSKQREMFLSIVVDLETRLAASKHAERDAIDDRFVMASKLELALEEIRQNEEQVRRLYNKKGKQEREEEEEEEEEEEREGKFEDKSDFDIRYESMTLEFIKLQKSLDEMSIALSKKSSEVINAETQITVLKRKLLETSEALAEKSSYLEEAKKKAELQKETPRTRIYASIQTDVNTMCASIQTDIDVSMNTINVSIQTEKEILIEKSTETDSINTKIEALIDNNAEQLIQNDNAVYAVAAVEKISRLQIELEVMSKDLIQSKIEIERLNGRLQETVMEEDMNKRIVLETVSKSIQTFDEEKIQVFRKEEDKFTQTLVIETIETATIAIQTEIYPSSTIIVPQIPILLPPTLSLPLVPDTEITSNNSIVDEFFYSAPALPPSQPSAIENIARPRRSSSMVNVSLPIPLGALKETENLHPPTSPSTSPPPPPSFNLLSNPPVSPPLSSSVQTQPMSILSAPAPPLEQPTSTAISRPLRSRASTGFVPVVAETHAPPSLHSQHPKVLTTSARQVLYNPAIEDWVTLQNLSTPTKTGKVESLSPPTASINQSHSVLSPPTISFIQSHTDIDTNNSTVSKNANDATDIEPVSFFIESQVVDTSGTSDANSTFLYRLSPTTPPKTNNQNEKSSLGGLSLSFSDQESFSSSSKTPLRDIVESLVSGYQSLSSISKSLTNEAWITLTQATPSTSPSTIIERK
jgi:hypothetical protein